MARRGETRERVLSATVRTLAAEGFSGTTARSIARTGGFAPGVIYYHFEDLTDLLLAALQHTSELRMLRYTEVLAPPLSGVELLARLRELYEEDLSGGHIPAVQELIAGASGTPRLREGILPHVRRWEAFAAQAARRLLDGSPLQGLLPGPEIGTVVLALFLGVQTLTHLDRERAQAKALFAAAEPMAALWDALTGGSSSQDAPHHAGEQMPVRHRRPGRGALKGWRKPEGAVMVTRPARWSNPYKIQPYGPYSRDEAIDLFEADLVAGRLVTGTGRGPLGVAEARRELAGRDLVCACGPEERCHGDVLLRWANDRPDRPHPDRP